jgi:hypothetical protein
MLTVLPDYYGKLRVLLSNLQQGVDPDPAYRNAFGKTPPQIEKEAAAYLAAGSFQTADLSGRPLNARRDFVPKQAEPPVPELALADLLLRERARSGEAKAAYEAVLKKHSGNARALEGLGLLALREKRADEARKHFEAAIAASSANARIYAEYARIEPEGAKALAALRKAAELNRAWAEPHKMIAQREADPKKKMEALKAATALEPRNAGYWRALAEACLDQKQFGEAGKAWAAAESASVDETERAQVREARRRIEEQRLEYEAAERRRIEAEKIRDLERVKAAAMAEVRAAEERANRGQGGRVQKVEEWREGEAPSGKVQGTLRQIDCLRGTLRLVIHGADGKVTRLAIRDPKQVVVIGGGHLDVACGPQRNPRNVVIEFFPRSDPKLATSGTVASIEYR